MRIPQLTLLALAVAALVPSAAAAKHGQPNTFERTFPAESRLCAAVAAGNVPTPLQGSETQVTDACTALHAAYDAAVAAVTGTATPDAAALKTAMADAIAQVQAACGPDATDPEACGAALQQAHEALKAARHGNKDAKHAYRQAIETARHAFRQALRPLKHGPNGVDRPHAPKGPHGDNTQGNDGTTDAPTDAPPAPTTDA
jgi:hypothetical protein